jgi:hypothetical protein
MHQVKKGDRVRICKGTPIWQNGKAKIAGRTYTVTVHHIYPGCKLFETSYQSKMAKHLAANSDTKYFPTTVSWAGSGGYWVDCNIEHVTLVESKT